MKFNYILFTDASVKSDNNAAYAVVVLNPNTHEYVTLSSSIDNNSIIFGEGTAVLEGLKYIRTLVKKYKLKDVKILVVSDSLTTVNILSSYIFTWKKSTKHWISTKGKHIKNQSLYENIYSKFLMDKNYTIRFIHIRSHMRADKDLSKVKRWLTNQHVKLNRSTLNVFIQLNALADKLAGDTADQFEYIIWPTQFS